jgi:hypothetical protein
MTNVPLGAAESFLVDVDIRYSTGALMVVARGCGARVLIEAMTTDQAPCLADGFRWMIRSALGCGLSALGTGHSP